MVYKQIDLPCRNDIAVILSHTFCFVERNGTLSQSMSDEMKFLEFRERVTTKIQSI